ncbi:MAG: glycerophosphodiester phosphodiesterase family protein [Gammaproteobacteria bacterium]|nr:glycerophosphodiester phosphodiesterase family protein [Gammaproteobacteria bacterium]
MKMKIPHLVAHRGQTEHYPENTLIALQNALKSGACYVEFDVQCTADNKFVVIHDVELERTTGEKGHLFEMTYHELENIRAHEPERFSRTFENERIPALIDVVHLLQRYPKANALVEIKEETLDQFGIENIMPALLKELEIIQRQCCIISFDYDAITYVKKHSDYLTGWVLHAYDDNSFKQASTLEPDYLIVNHQKLPADEIPWPGPWLWMVYEITEPELAIHYANRNIPLVETFNISSMLEHPMLMQNKCDHSR